ncbi:MAG: hypothetical protein P4L75_03615 [Clostridia bacterium]|nr:hypothetical protein [Clostridia bacterium]MDR3644768.1 hypothetical protein [Clostridia bacterium]
MVRECVVIIVILVIAGYVFLRSRRRMWFGAVFPLMLVPLVNTIFSPHFLDRLPHGYDIRLVIYLACFAISSLWIALWSKKLPVGKSRSAYIFSSIGFTFVLVIVLIVKGANIE